MVEAIFFGGVVAVFFVAVTLLNPNL